MQGRPCSSVAGGEEMDQESVSQFEELLDYRRRVAEIYRGVRMDSADLATRCAAYRSARDDLFRMHSQSPIPVQQRSRFEKLCYYDYDPAFRFVLPVDTDVEPEVLNIELQDDGLVRMRRFGRIQLIVGGQELALSVFWILGYGGGVLLPFRDTTGPQETYGGGRYVLDTIKHADLGQENGRLVIDFNYAYNPSCAYDPRWHCPLAPRENHLPVPIPAGEKR